MGPKGRYLGEDGCVLGFVLTKYPIMSRSVGEYC